MHDASSTTSGKPDGNPDGRTTDSHHNAGAPLTLSQLSALIDKELGESEWFAIDQPSINAFADVTGDWQSIHVDEELARVGPFGGTIAHGFLTLSLLSAMAFNVLPTLDGQQNSVNYGLNSVRFITPVRSGERVRGRFTLKQVTQRSITSIQLTIGVVVEIEDHQKPALVAEWLTLINT
ncbi:MaoC family dehydratase [Burkholderia sp. Ac-20353]|uniref:MaoC family dehydratase n=1 Tax=Burkholderia sp. Ac-20353 TaxID=2703894 RepID=UPI00197C2127|nr:MaoC family dehydratase [Burkholderia sp. Ac-20353]MBN3788541.1 MaoC family dehydratase [Burkholderia sp. Ac-20353]